jgi:hypothetical protein
MIKEKSDILDFHAGNGRTAYSVRNNGRILLYNDIIAQKKYDAKSMRGEIA